MQLDSFLSIYAGQRDISPGYEQQLSIAVRSLCRWRGYPVAADELTPDLVNSWLADLRARGMAPATRADRRRCLLTLWRAAADRDLAPEPQIRLIATPRIRGSIVRAWSIAQVQCLLDAATSLQGTLGASRIAAAAYWSSWVRAAWDTGLRGCDLRALERAWIPAGGRLQIIQGKTGRPICLQLRSSTIEAVDRSFPPDRRLIWPLWSGLRTWRRYARAIVLRSGLHGSIGRLRHSAGTAAELAHPGRGHQLLGNSRRVFERHYCDPLLAVADQPLPPELPQ